MKQCSAGVRQKIEDIEKGREKRKTAQVLRLVHKFKYTPLISPNSVIVTHECFKNADIVLQPHIHLLSIEDDQARFIEFDKDIGMEVLNTRKYPLLISAQVSKAKKIINVPRNDFDEIVSGLEIGQGDVVWLFHSARCGSTAWSQIFNALPNWTVISESFTHVYNMICTETDFDLKELSETSRYEEMVVSLIKMHLKLAPKGNNLLFKGTATDVHKIPKICKRFPKHKILFGYRDVLPSARSYFQAFAADMEFLVDYCINPWLKKVRYDDVRARQSWLLFTNGYDKDQSLAAIRLAMPDPSIMEWYVLSWAGIMIMMSEFQLKGVPFKSIKYEDLKTQPAELLQRVFEYLGIPTRYTNLALQTLKEDSQTGLFFDHDKRKHLAVWTRTGSSVSKCNAILDHFNLPDLDSSYFMTNDIMLMVHDDPDSL